VPAGTSFVSADSGGLNVAGTVTWNLGDLTPGPTDLHIFGHVDAGRLADLSNTASVSSTTADPDTSNNSANEATTVATSADVSITKSDSPDPVTAGTDLSYTLTVTTAGPSLSLRDALPISVPAGTSFVSADSGGLNVAGTVTWNL